MKLGLKIAGNMAAVAAGKAAAIIFGLLTFAMIARHLGADGLGTYRIVLTVLAFAGMTADFGIYAITLREISIDREKSGKIFGNALTCRLTCTTCAVGLVCAAAWAMPISRPLRMGLLVAGTGWVAYQASEFLVGIFQEKMRQDYVAFTETAAAVVTFLGVLAVTQTQAGLQAMLAATAFGFAFAFVSRVILARRLIAFKLQADVGIWWSLMKAGIPVAASYALVLVYVRGDILLLAYFHSPHQVGIYDIAAKIYETVTTFPHLFGGLILPLMTRDFGVSRERYTDRLAGALAAVVGVMIAVVMPLAFYAEDIAALLGGPEFELTAGPMRVLAAAMLVAAPGLVLRFAALAAGNQRKMLLVDILGVIFGLGCYGLLIPSLSYFGAAAGRTLVDGVILIGATFVSSAPGIWRASLRPMMELLPAVVVLAASMAILSKTIVPWYINAGCGVLLYFLMLVPMPNLRRTLQLLSAE